MKHQKAVLILGLFIDASSTKQNIRSAEDRIAAMFRNNNIPVITSSAAAGKTKRFIDTVSTLITRRQEYDIAIVPLFGTWPSFLWQEIVTRILKQLNKKIVLGIHGGSIPERIDKGAQRFYTAMKRADILFAPSAYFSSMFTDKGFDVEVIENPVDLANYKFCAKEKIRPRIIWMRAFTDIYNPLMAVRVAKRLAEKYNDFEMVMAGKEGPLYNATKIMAERFGLKDKILFPGYINMQQKQAYAASYDIYICTNKIDNTPVSLTEFMQFGLPIVSVNTGGIPYMIEDGVNGLLVDADDDKSMFEKINMLIQNQALAQTIIANAYRNAQQYNDTNVVKKWSKVLNELSNG
ncbi:glycosyltransferase family 4 protein [Panacibacter ginsenosidivorans]|uniref:Glycosyltransferase family 4 protein n=1 Tax=Panacibacter ginsenosidivorans TaxID=1813871 RepID=A0A5B8VC67_9BACT|nr:glycosyltransferase family 4 protein [Panacibacter ginsenosidivorans]QEC69100.1 glycosyltransferase family 4 protein [Panacibacter ginsenosidivorans]